MHDFRENLGPRIRRAATRLMNLAALALEWRSARPIEQTVYRHLRLGLSSSAGMTSLGWVVRQTVNPDETGHGLAAGKGITEEDQQLAARLEWRDDFTTLLDTTTGTSALKRLISLGTANIFINLVA